MKTTDLLEQQQDSTRKRIFQALALGFMMAHMPAMAQDQASTDDTDAEAEALMEEVIVSGTRRALQNSIDIKRSAPGIVDAMSMGDIGDIPSLSVGEAIEQITGASGHRFKGSVSGISIRGLGPFLTLQTFNGRQGTTAAASRDMNYQVFPSELTKSITIYKSQQADLIEGGTAGTIDIGTVRPLDYGRRSVSVNMRAKYNDYADRSDNGDPWGYRGSISYIDQWEMASGNQVGLSVGYSRWDSGNPEEMYSTSSSWKICSTHIDRKKNRCSEYDQQDQADDLKNGIVRDTLYWIPHSMYWRMNNDEVEVRDAIIGAFQWQSDNMDLTIDGFWSDKYYEDDRHDFIIDDTRDEHYDVVHGSDYQLLSYTGVSRIRNDGELYRRDETLTGVGLDYGWRINDRWEVRMDLSNNNHTRDRERRYVRTRLGNPVMYDMVLGKTLPDIYFHTGEKKSPNGTTIISDFDPNDLSQFDRMSDFRLRNRQTNRETDAWGVALDAIYRPEPGGFFESVNFGVREGEYERITNNEDDRHWRVRDDNFLDLYWDGARDIEEELFQAMIDECSYDPFPNSKFFNNSGGTNIGGSWATFDTLCATRLLTNGENALLAPDRTLNESDINVVESTTAGYVMANFYSENTSVPIWGNFGVRVVETEVDSKGLRTTYVTDSYYDKDDDAVYWFVEEADVLDEVRFKHTNTEWLPSANVNFEISDTFMIRAALYRAMSRYNIEFMGAGRSFDVEDWDDQEYGSAEEAIEKELDLATGGNPEIEPFMSWNADVSFEWYLSEDTAFSFAVYYKYLEAELFPQIFQEPLTVDGETMMVDIQRNVVTDNSSDLWGFEVTASHVFSDWRPPFDGLGFKVSWNHSDTDFETQDPLFGDQLQGDGTVLPGMNELVPASIYGQSDDIGTVHLFWDIGSLNLSAFWKYRSEYFQPNDGDPRVNRWFDDYTYWDLSATYRFNSVWKARFTAQNITEEPQLGDRGNRDGSPTLWVDSGTKYELGVTATWD